MVSTQTSFITWMLPYVVFKPLRTKTSMYLMELKLNKSADAAMNQIDLKKYPERFALCGLPIVKVAINFDSESRTLKDWRIN